MTNNANAYLPGTIQIPSALEVVAITQSFPMVVTVSANPVTQSNVYINDQLVRFNIPFGYGMQQLNGQTLKIFSVSGNDLTFNIDSRNFDSFSVPISGLKPATIAPAGSNNLSYSNETNNVPFQSLNNRGN